MAILRTNEVNCKDCYKCIRYCPVNAIKVVEGHAYIDTERCILDGKCYKVCPQHAKVIKNDLEEVKNIIKLNKFVVASIAPAFFAYYQEPLRGKILTALKFLGFSHAEQTSRGAYAVAKAHYEYYAISEKPVITSSCPATVNLIEKYYPELIEYLAPVVSPMVAHYKLLENEYRKPFKMIFISPCIAKKEEFEGTEIEASITFEELEQWIKDEDIDLESLEPSSFDEVYPVSSSLFPLLGGLINAAELKDSSLENEIISVSGIENIQTLLNSIKEGKINSKFIEVLACEGGCVMGPARPLDCQNKSYHELRANLINSFENEKPTKKPEILTEKALHRTYKDKSISRIEPTEEEIKVILASIGKTKQEDELNCGACGYYSCREKAIAVIQGMAEKEMCIPYMRSQAERFSAIVLEATPNCVIVLDQNLNVIEANPSFLKLIGLNKDDIKGKNISTITDDEPFKEVLSNSGLVNESTTIFMDKKLKRIVFSVPDQKLITGIFVDITDAETHKAALLKVKTETLERAQKVIDKQMRVAQEIAGLLGETTAETKVLLGQLVKILHQE